MAGKNTQPCDEQVQHRLCWKMSPFKTSNKRQCKLHKQNKGLMMILMESAEGQHAMCKSILHDIPFQGQRPQRHCWGPKPGAPHQLLAVSGEQDHPALTRRSQVCFQVRAALHIGLLIIAITSTGCCKPRRRCLLPGVMSCPRRYVKDSSTFATAQQ